LPKSATALAGQGGNSRLPVFVSALRISSYVSQTVDAISISRHGFLDREKKDLDKNIGAIV
jgi:hypothetical protein